MRPPARSLLSSPPSFSQMISGSSSVRWVYREHINTLSKRSRPNSGLALRTRFSETNRLVFKAKLRYSSIFLLLLLIEETVIPSMNPADSSNYSCTNVILGSHISFFLVLNVLKQMSHPRDGYSHKILLLLCQSPVRCIIDNDSSIYGLTPSSRLRILDPIQNWRVGWKNSRSQKFRKMFLKFTIAVLSIYFIDFHEICSIVCE